MCLTKFPQLLNKLFWVCAETPHALNQAVMRELFVLLNVWYFLTFHF